MSADGGRSRRSDVWLHFTPKSGDKATCVHCEHELSYRGSTSNLRKHYAAKHSALGELTPRKARQVAPVMAASEASTITADVDNVDRDTAVMIISFDNLTLVNPVADP